MEAENYYRSQYQTSASYGAIRSDQTHQLRYQSLGSQTRVWLFQTLGPLDS